MAIPKPFQGNQSVDILFDNTFSWDVWMCLLTLCMFNNNFLAHYFDLFYTHLYTYVHTHVWVGSLTCQKTSLTCQKTSLTCQKNESDMSKKRVWNTKKTSLTSYDITYPTFLKTESLLPVPTSTLSSDIINPQNPKNESGIPKNESGNFSEFFWRQTGYSYYCMTCLTVLYT